MQRCGDNQEGKDSTMHITLERTTRGCFSDNCPERHAVVGAPGGAVFIGRRLEDMDPEAFATIQDRIGPGEAAFWVPDELL
jgi:hypothetical protein